MRQPPAECHARFRSEARSVRCADHIRALPLISAVQEAAAAARWPALEPRGLTSGAC